jgi:two-component system CheB/CheR fusion protein
MSAESDASNPLRHRGSRDTLRHLSPGVIRGDLRVRVLIIDDNADAADSMAMLLQIEGHDVDAAYSPEDGMRKAASFAPELVLLDIGLPRIDGCEVARRLRDSGFKARLVAVTGHGDETSRARIREAGFDAHLLKPVEFDALGELLRPS